MRSWGLVAVAVALVLAGCGATARADDTLVVKMQVLKQGRQVLLLVPVTIDGKGPFTFAVDTGAAQSLVDSQVAKRIAAPRTGNRAKVAGVSSVTKMATVRFENWSVGGVKLPATTIVTGNLPFGNASGGVQGLLGSDMLSRFQTVTIDYRHGVLRLR